jgi:pimeloyl-ACP methyl ester carboxylesterase
MRETTVLSVLRAVGAEVGWFAAHAVLYPLGALAERAGARRDALPLRLDDLPPLRRGMLVGDLCGGTGSASAPILLVHGIADNRSVFTVLRRSLRRRGLGEVHTVNYSPFTSDVRAAAVALGRAVESLCERTGYDRVHVIAHSLGGVIARYYVQRLGGDAQVHTLVTLGAPHAGTRAARVLPLPLCRQLRPGSDLFAELAAPAPGCRTRFVAVWSDLDQVIRPPANARLQHPDLNCRDVAVRGIGHMSLPFARDVAYAVALALTPERQEVDRPDDLAPTGST